MELPITDLVDLFVQHESENSCYSSIVRSDVYLEVFSHCLDKVFNMADYGKRLCQEGSAGYRCYENIKLALEDALEDIQYRLAEWNGKETGEGGLGNGTQENT